jgi:hypothetical protein
LRAGEIQDSINSNEESKHLGYYSVQTIIRCLVKMKPEEQKTFQPAVAEEIESFVERYSQVDPLLILSLLSLTSFPSSPPPPLLSHLGF